MKNPRTIDPKRNRWMYAIGTSGRDFFYQLYSGYLFAFILCTKNLDSAQFAAVSIVMVGCRAFDAIIDPIIGRIIENTRSRWGRFKPWIVIGGVLAAFATMMIYTLPIDGWSFILLLFIGNALLSATYSLNDIAYWGMLPALTSKPEERTKLTSLSQFFASVGFALAVLLIPTLTNGSKAIGGSAVTAYRIMALLCCLAMWGTQLFTVFGTHEPPHTVLNAQKAPKLKLRDVIRIVFKNDQLLWSSASTFLLGLAGIISQSNLLMFYIYIRFGYEGSLIPLSSFGFAIGGWLATAIMAKMHEKYGRQRTVAISSLLFVAGNVFILLTGLLIPSAMQMPLFFTFSLGQILTGFGSNMFYMTMLVSIANTVEYNEHHTGKRQEALIFSVRPFVSQMSSAVSLAVVSAVFIVLGLNSVSTEMSTLENQAAQNLLDAATKNAQITTLLSEVGMEKVRVLLIAITLIPAALVVTACLIYRKKYFINEEYYNKMREETLARSTEE
ncbi:MAG: MFS transporter [Oscillospiraceae bacterium]|jgi:melibiose permease/lactose/raffinose/galactose permease|nr:MFS transporter [Oscillospiraceae bacterium]